MPTTRPRYQVAETPDVARAVDQLTEDDWADVRAAQRMVGRYGGASPEGYLKGLRTDWPA